MKTNRIKISTLRSLIESIINEEYVLNEYINNDMISLRDYLSMPIETKMEYLPHEYSYFFNDFLEEMGYEFEMPKEKVKSDYMDEPDEEVNMFEYDDELITYLERNDKITYNDFARYLYDKIESNTLPIPERELPAWTYFDRPILVKNQWLIHFTNDAQDIARDGFKYGVNDMTKLGLTTHFGEFEKKYGGYNFAFLLSDFERYGKSSYGSWTRSYKYGNEAVIFNASGIKVWHKGDEEYQVIFFGNTAKNIIPITRGSNKKFGVYDKKGKLLYENDKLENVVNWIVNNYNQYRKVL